MLGTKNISLGWLVRFLWMLHERYKIFNQTSAMFNLNATNFLSLLFSNSGGLLINKQTQTHRLSPFFFSHTDEWNENDKLVVEAL